MERYNRWGITNEEAMNLHDGEGFLFSKRVNKLRIQVNRRQSPDDSQSPGIESIRKHRPESLTPSRNQANTLPSPRSMPAPTRRLPREHEEETWPQGAFVFQEYATGGSSLQTAAAGGRGLPNGSADEREEEPMTLLERGIIAYQEEGATSISKLAAALEISPWEARNLLPKVQTALKREA